jgi:ABC-2 type transport system permease protein
MRILAFVERDLRKFLRNPIAILSSILLPMVYLLIIGNSFQGSLKNLPLAVVNQDGGPYAERMLDRLRSIETGPNTFRLIYLSDPSAAEKGVRQGRFKGAVVIPSDFSKNVDRGTVPQVGLVLDNTEAVSAAALQQALSEGFNALKIDAVPIRSDPRVPQIYPIELYQKIDYDASLVPGAVIMAIFMGTMITGAFNLVMDRFLGVHEAYLSTPLTKIDMVFGILISGVLVTTLISLVVLGAGIWMTQVPVAGGAASFLAVLLVIVLTAMGLLSMMCALLSRVDHPRIVGLLGGFLNVIFFFPSGAVYPVESFPPWLQAFSKVNPETYSVHALKSVLFKGAEWRAVQGDIVYLIGFTLVMLMLSIKTFKRDL